MKKRICLCLVATLLFALVAVFPAMAADSPTPLAVTHVSATENLNDDKGDPIDWSKVWNPSNTTRLGTRFNENVEMIGKLNTPSRITKITICNQYYSTRSNNIIISFSTDGENWTNAITLLGIPDVRKTANTYTLPVVDDTEYSYVKLSKPVALKETKGESSSANDSIWFDLRWVAFYCDTESVPTPVKVNHISAMDGAPATIANIWNPDNAASCNFNTSGKNGELIRGGFETPTILTDIYVKLLYPSYNARMNHMIFEGSNNGETWKEVARTNGTLANAGNIVHLRVTDTTPYKYIRMVKNQTYGWWSCISLTFLGEAQPEEVVPVSFQGYQRSVAADETYSLRLICTVNEEGVTNVGARIECASEEGYTWSFDQKAGTLLDKIEQPDGTSITAESLGGTAIYTAVITGIPADIGLFSLKVTPYATVNDDEKKGKSKTVVMKDVNQAESTLFDLLEQQDMLKVSGRSTPLEDGIACDFTASGIEFNAKLAGDVTLKVTCSGTTYYTLYVNGERQPQRLCFETGTNEYTILRGMAAGTYTVKLVKQTHVAHTISTLHSLSMAGNLLDPPAENDLMIEFIGDSITCGYGTVGYPTTGVTYYGTAEYCDATAAYAYKTASLLNADYSMISVSGWALLPDANQSGYLPGIYDKTCYKRGDARYTPKRTADVVVIHLGTNDVNGRSNYETDFVKAAKEFTAAVRQMNPDAKVVWAYGSMMTGDKLTNFEAKIGQILSELGGEEFGVYGVKLPYDQSAGNGHPSDAGHTSAANVLSAFIRDTVLSDK